MGFLPLVAIFVRSPLSPSGPLASKPVRILLPPTWPKPASVLPQRYSRHRAAAAAALAWCRSCCLAGLWCPPIWAKEIASRSRFGPAGAMRWV